MKSLAMNGLFILMMLVCSACAAGGGDAGDPTNADDTQNSGNLQQEGTDYEQPGNINEEQQSADHPTTPDDQEDDNLQPDNHEQSLEQSVPETEGEAAHEAIKSQYDITDPASIAVLVNKEYGLPEDYEPVDLVKPDIPFVYEYEEVHFLREAASEALIEMFEASKDDGIELSGVSGYRSYAIQKTLYDNYVKRDGVEAANRYSAKPGHSEHSTGLAMDVAGISGKCAANNCFADTEEAKWVAEHAHEFGFIVRYPLGKEEITGYQYEPWHLRYVGKELAQLLKENEWTMEEFFLDTSAAGEE